MQTQPRMSSQTPSLSGVQASPQIYYARPPPPRGIRAGELPVSTEELDVE